MGSFFLNLNRNKRSVVLDLKKPEDAQAMQDLLQKADVFVHNMRSGPLTKLGLDYESLKTRNPKLIHASALGFGRSGDYFDQPAYDDVIQSLSGVAGINGSAYGDPAYVPALLSDKLCGVYLAQAIGIALFHREKTGRAQQVEVPMLETMVSFNLLEHLADNVLASSDGPQSQWPGYARVLKPSHRPLETRDGHISIIANTDGQWQRLFALIGIPELMDDPRFGTIGNRMKHVGDLYAIVESHLALRTSAEWLQDLRNADIPCAPIQSLDDVRDDPHLKSTGFFKSFKHPTEGVLTMPGVATFYSDSPADIRMGPPRLGEHTGEVLNGMFNG